MKYSVTCSPCNSCYHKFSPQGPHSRYLQAQLLVRAVCHISWTDVVHHTVHIQDLLIYEDEVLAVL